MSLSGIEKLEETKGTKRRRTEHTMVQWPK